MSLLSLRQLFAVPLLTLSVVASAQTVKPGIPAAQRNISRLRAEAVYAVPGHPDWMAIAGGTTWVASADVNRVFALDAATHHVRGSVVVENPCSGLAVGFGSLWVPSCDAHALYRIDLRSKKILAKISVAPADSEGGISTGGGGVWLPCPGGLARIDPVTNMVAAVIKIAPGSYAAAFAGGAVWITSTEQNLITRVNSRTNRVVATVAIGPRPRFLTTGAGSVWTLNQSDGTVSRVDMKTNRLVATIPVGTPGKGGDIAFGGGAVWTTAFSVPLTRIDPRRNRISAQWIGAGGDSVRARNRSLWLTDYHGGSVSRFKLHL